MDFNELAVETIKLRIREEALGRRDAQIEDKLDQARFRLEQINELHYRLKESEEDRAARLKMINKLTDMLKESEADRTARFDQITKLTDMVKESEADRATRLEVIHNLEQGWQALEETFVVRQARRLGLIKTRRREECGSSGRRNPAGTHLCT